MSCRSCSAVVDSAPSTPARRCAITLGLRGHPDRKSACPQRVSHKLQRYPGIVEDFLYRIEQCALPLVHVVEVVLRSRAVLPFEFVRPIFGGAESAPQAVGQCVEIASEVSAGPVDGRSDLAIEVVG